VDRNAARKPNRFILPTVFAHHQHYYFLGDYGGCLKLKTKDLTDYDLGNLLRWAVMTKTPNYIKSIFDLKCFKKPMTSNSYAIIGTVTQSFV